MESPRTPIEEPASIAAGGPFAWRGLAVGLAAAVVLGGAVAFAANVAQAYLCPWLIFPLVVGIALGALLVGAVCFSAGLVAVTTRIELGLGIGALGLVSFVLGDWRQARRSWLPLALGGAAGYALLGATFGHIVPDTAIAKAFGPMSLGEAVLVALFSSVTSFSFGIGLMLLWCASFVALLRTASVKWRVATLIVNSVLPVLVLFVAVRGQAVQGVRHLLWAYAFAITWNMLALERRHGAERGEFAPLQGRVQRRILAGLAISVAAVWAVEVPLTLRILAARRGVLQGMREARLERLAGMTGAAFDVGYVGYLSKAQILDLSGLVNGREVASMSSRARLERVALRRPQFLFLTSEQVDSVGAALDVTQYVVVRSFRSRRVSSDERYALAVLRPLAPAIGSDCAEEQPTLAEFASAGGAIPCLGNH